MKMKKLKKLKNWMDGEILHLITLKGEMELEFVKNAKKKVNVVFILEIQPLWGSIFHFLRGRERS
jgi:hypothetical protein